DHRKYQHHYAGQYGQLPRAETLEVRDDSLDLFRHGSTAPASLPMPTLDREACAKMKSGRVVGAARFHTEGKLARSALEQGQDVLRCRVGDRQRLDAELLLNLERLQLGRFLVHVGVDKLA